MDMGSGAIYLQMRYEEQPISLHFSKIAMHDADYELKIKDILLVYLLWCCF